MILMKVAYNNEKAGLGLFLAEQNPLENIEPFCIATISGGTKASKTLEELSKGYVIPTKVTPDAVEIVTFAGKQATVPPEFVTPANQWWVISDSDEGIVGYAPVLSEATSLAFENAELPSVLDFAEELDNYIDSLEAGGHPQMYSPEDVVYLPVDDNTEASITIKSSKWNDRGERIYEAVVDESGEEVLLPEKDLAVYNNPNYVIWLNPQKV